MKLVEGELDSKKTRHISDEEYAEGWRLACVSSVTGDVTVEVPDIASAYQSRMKVADLSSKAEVELFERIKHQVEDAGLELKNSMRIVSVSMNPPTLDDTMPDNERLSWALEDATGLSIIRIPYSVLKKLPDVLRASNFSVQCVIRVTKKDVFVYDILPADAKAIAGGLIVDIGTTTVSALLVDMLTGEILAKASAGNGTDPLRRGCNQQDHRVREARRTETASGRDREGNPESDDPADVCERGFSGQHIYRMAVAGNTTMEHLLMGINADPLRMEPYIPTFFKTNSLYASDIGIAIHRTHILLWLRISEAMWRRYHRRYAGQHDLEPSGNVSADRSGNQRRAGFRKL